MLDKIPGKKKQLILSHYRTGISLKVKDQHQAMFHCLQAIRQNARENKNKA